MLFFFSHPRFGWLISFPILAAIAPNSHAQSHSGRGSSVMTPSMMMQRTTTNTTTDALLQRNLRLDARILGEMRFDRFSMRDYGRMTYMGVGGYGANGGYAGGYSGVGGYGSIGAGYTPTTVAGAAGVSPLDAAKAALLNEQVIAERLVNRRRAFDEELYERERTPTAEQALLDRSRNAPRLSEILSSQALNALLTDLQRLSAGNDLGDLARLVFPLDDDQFRHINWTRGSGSMAILKSEGQLNWPSVLTDPAFRQPRERLALLAPQAIEQLRRHRSLNPTIIGQMVDDAREMRVILRQKALSLSFQEFVETKKFLQNLDEALLAMQQPDAADHLTGTLASRPQTVLELVRRTARHGLRFAPAIPGDESVYVQLCDALRACDIAAKSQLALR